MQKARPARCVSLFLDDAVYGFEFLINLKYEHDSGVRLADLRILYCTEVPNVAPKEKQCNLLSVGSDCRRVGVHMHVSATSMHVRIKATREQRRAHSRYLAFRV